MIRRPFSVSVSPSGAIALAPGSRATLLGIAAGLVLAAAAALVALAPEEGPALIGLSLGALFLVRHPHWGVLVIFVFVMFRLNPVRLGPLSSAEVFAAALLAPLAFELIRDRRVWPWRVPQVRLLFAIGFMFLVATEWSLLMHPTPPVEVRAERWSEPLAFAQFLLFLLYLLYFIKTPRHLTYAVVVVLALILSAAADGVGLLRDGAAGTRAGTKYFEGFAGNANRLGFLCVWGTALFWALRFKGPRGWWQPLTIVPLLVLPVATLLTGSRNALLQLTLLAVLILLDQRRGSPAQRARAFAAILTMAVVVLAATPTEMILRASNFDTTGGSTTIDRINTYRAGLVMIVEHPIFGVGPGNFMWRNEALTGRATSPHNAYLWAITSGGPLLLLLYLVLFYRTYGMLRTVERWGPPRFVWLATALRFNLLTFLVASLFATIWLQEPFWLLVGLTVILGRVAGGRPPGTTAPHPATVATR